MEAKTLVFVDSQVENYQSLIAETATNIEVIVLNSSEDGIQQITEALTGRTGIESVQIISHGNDGELQLGTTQLSAENLDNYTQHLSQWRDALTSDADILLAGCNVAASDSGKGFIQQLSQMTGADVAASENLTGNADLGGDWVLEYTTGLIDAPLALQVEAMAAYESIFANFNVGNAAELTNALNQATNNFQADEITLTGNINNFNSAFNIDLQDSQPLSIIGNGNTIDGGNNSQIFSIFNGEVLLSNLTLTNGLAEGGEGENGGGGGLGAGGALYIGGGNVTVENVTFNNNQAIGGNSPDGAGRGGPDEGSGTAGGNGGGLNGRQDGVGMGGGGGGRENNGSPGTDGQFGAGGGGAGGGGGGDTAPDDAGNGGRGGNGGFGGGGGGGGGGGRDVDIFGGDENGSGGAGGNSEEFGGNGGAGVGGGGSRNGGTGGGGAGLGGAIFVNSGASLSLIDASFNNNTAQGGTGANNGQGRGGAIFVRNGATVNDVGTTYNGNSASNGDNDIFGNTGDLTLPTLQVFGLTTPGEPDTDGAFFLSLSQAFPNDISVNYSISGTATENTDYTIDETVTIPAGQTSVNIPVDISDDTRFEPIETVILTLEPGSPNFYNLDFSNSATLFINDNEPEVSITAGTTPNENGRVGTFNINLTQPAPTGGLAVDYNIAGTSIPNTDYTLEFNGTPVNNSFTVPAGATNATINVIPFDDSFIEGSETVELSLIEPPDLENYAVRDDAATASLTLEDNETQPVVQLRVEGNPAEAGPVGGSFIIFLADAETGEPLENPPSASDGSELELTVSYEINGTADNGEDYTRLLSQTVTIPAGRTQTAIALTTLDDFLAEGDETVTVTLTDNKPDDAIYTIDTTPATLSILDNDTAGITISEISGATHEQGGEASFTVKLDSQPEEPVTLNFTSSDSSEGEVITSSVTVDSSNWNQPQTVTVRGVDDTERDGDETYTIEAEIDSEDENYSNLNLEAVTVTNIDDETENVLITQSGGNTEVGEDGTTDSFDVVLTGFPIDVVEVDIIPDSQTDLGEGAGKPITLQFTPQTASIPQTVSVQAIDDQEVEGNHTSTITYDVKTNDPLYTALGGEFNVSVSDNDNPTVSLNAVGNGSEQSLIAGVFQLALDHPAGDEGITVNYTVSGDATPGVDYTIVGLDEDNQSGSIFIAPGETGVNLNVTPIQDLFTEEESVTIQLETGSGYIVGTVDPESIKITDDDVPGVRVLETGRGTEVVEQNLDSLDFNKADTYQISLTSSPDVGETVSITPNYNNDNLQLRNSDNNPITEITFNLTNWNQPQIITVVGLNDNQAGTPEQTISHSANSSNLSSAYNSDLELPEITVAITEPTFDAGEVADGLSLLFDRISDSFTEIYEDLSLPLVGLLNGSEPAFIETIKTNLINEIKSTANLTQQKLEDILQEKLEPIFSDVGIATLSLPEEVSFEIDLGDRYFADANLSSDFGLPGLGLEVDGKAEVNFDYELDLKFGYHNEFGFYIDTNETQITADALVNLSDGFNTTASLGFLELNLADGAEDQENGGIKKTQAELNADFKLKDFDINTEEDDGSRLTLDELKAFNQRRQADQASLKDLFDLTVEADAQLGLNSRTTVLGNAAIPSFVFELTGDFDALKFEDFRVTGPQNPTIGFQNVNLDIGSFVSNFAQPILGKVDDILEPLRPIRDALIQDTKLLSKLGLAGTFDKKWPVPNGGDSQVATIELADVALRALGQQGLPPELFKFLDTFNQIDSFVQQVNSIPGGDTILIPLGNFSLPKTEDFIEIGTDIEQNAIALKEELQAIANSTTDRVKKQAAEFLQQFTDGISLPQFEDFSKIEDNIQILEDELNNLKQTTPDDLKRQAIQFLQDFADDFITSKLGDFSEINLSEIQQQVTNIEAELDRLSQSGNNRQRQTAEFTKSFTYGTNGEALFDVPLLEKPENAIALLLGQDVPLFTFDVPEVVVEAGVRKTFPVYGPISGLLEGQFKASADFAFGYDTYGLRQWKAQDFAADQAYRILDGFYISDRENADGTGEDVPEVKLNATVAAGAGLDLIAASGYLKGGIEGLFNLDLVDVGEVNGTDNGRIYAISEIVPRFDDLFSLLGEVNAFLGAEVKLFGSTVYDQRFATFNLIEFKLGNSSIGRVQDGYFVGSKVFLDVNFNGIQDYADLNGNGLRDFDDINNNGIRDTYAVPDLDTGETAQILEPYTEPFSEPSTFTNQDGSYNLNIFDDFDRNGNGIIDLDEGQIVAIEGIDTSTFLIQQVPLTTTPTAEMVTSLTTLATQLANPDFEPAITQVKNIFNLSADFDPFSDNAINTELNSLKWQVQLQNLGIIATQTLAESSFLGLEIDSSIVRSQGSLLYLDRNNNNQFDGEEPEVITSENRFLDLNRNEAFDENEPISQLTTAEIAKEIYQSIADLISSGETPDFSNDTILTNLLETAITRLTSQDPDLNLDSSVLTATVQTILEKNQAIDAILANSSTFLDVETVRQQILQPWAFFDANENGVQDENEPFVYQETDGTFELDIPVAEFDTNENGRLDPNEGEIVEVDASESVELAAGYSQLVEFPFATLVRLLTQSIDADATQSQVKTALELPDVDLYTFDPLAEIANGNSEGLTVFSQQSQVYNTVVQVSELISGVSGEDAEKIASQVLDHLANQIGQSDATLDLSNTTQIQDLITTAFPNISSEILTEISNLIVEENNQIEQIVDDPNLSLVEKATEIAKVQQVVQGEVATDLNAVGSGELTLEDAIAKHTGEALNSQIQAATAQDPTLISNINNNTPITESIQSLTTLEDTVLTINVLEISQDIDVDDNLSISNVGSLVLDELGEIISISPETSQGGSLEISEEGTSITYTPAANFFGEDSFFYAIADNQGGVANGEIKINVESVNDIPELTSEIPNPPNLEFGEQFSLDLSQYFTDADGDNLIYTASGLPNGLNIDAETSIISGVVNNEEGTFNIAVTATDPSGNSISDSFELNIFAVKPPNTPPQLTSEIPNPPNFELGEQFNLDLSQYFTDADGDNLIYTATGLPNGLNINAQTSIISGVVNNEEGTFNIAVTATDPSGESVSDSFELNIVEVKPTPPTSPTLPTPPTVTPTPEPSEPNVTTEENLFDPSNEIEAIAFPDLQPPNRNFSTSVIPTDNADAIAANGDSGIVFGLKGEDYLQGTEGDDEMNGNEDNDFIDGENGSDTIMGGKDDDQVRSGSGNDWIFGNLGEDILSGDRDQDWINGNQDNDLIDGGEGQDEIYGGKNDDQIRGGRGDDIVFGNLGADLIEGNEDNDVLYGNPNNDTLSGNMGNDFLYGGQGNDLLDGNSGDDILFGDEGDDTVDGGEGNDSLTGGNGDDLLLGAEGTDTITGGEGRDRFLISINSGPDIVSDFEVSQDTIVLDGNLTFEQLIIEQVESQTIIKLANEEILLTLNEIDANLVTADNFAKLF